MSYILRSFPTFLTRGAGNICLNKSIQGYCSWSCDMTRAVVMSNVCVKLQLLSEYSHSSPGFWPGNSYIPFCKSYLRVRSTTQLKDTHCIPLDTGFLEYFIAHNEQKFYLQVFPEWLCVSWTWVVQSSEWFTMVNVSTYFKHFLFYLCQVMVRIIVPLFLMFIVIILFISWGLAYFLTHLCSLWKYSIRHIYVTFRVVKLLSHMYPSWHFTHVVGYSKCLWYII